MVFRLEENLAARIPDALVPEINLAVGNDLDVVAMPDGSIGLLKVVGGNVSAVQP
jgi:antitoxin component of MazEF toxin-antitoxin module